MCSTGEVDTAENPDGPSTSGRDASAASLQKFDHLRVPLSVETINQRVVDAEYAVRGEIVRMAQVIANDLKHNRGSYPFDKVGIWCAGGQECIFM